ncbi:DEAD/DEAH box helicase [soil metagenome]
MDNLFAGLLHSNAPAETLVLRDYQLAALDSARTNIRQGKRRQILCSPTGSGKTIIALGLMKAAGEAGSRSAFITDRSALVDQTSAAMDRYGIDHGIMQADHWRSRPRALVQLVSAQTLGRRLGNGGYVDRNLRDLRFVLIDECHTLYRSTLDWLETLPESVAVIGLTATPFTRGLGRHFQAIVNVATTDGLIASGALTKPIVYAAVEADISGVAVTSAGEWDEGGLERAGVKIVGDVATEYLKRSLEHFGKPAKAIAFSSTVAHGEEICRAMAGIGLNFQNITYRDDEDERRAKIVEFRKPDSAITGLVSCDALAKGFDVPDVKVCLLCRPLRKSLSTHIQQIGRVMRPAPGKDKALVIDHTGNALRFLRDTVDFWAQGVDALDEGAEKDRSARTVTETERHELVCLGCQAVLPPGLRVCPGCGRERPPQVSDVIVVNGATRKIELSHPPLRRSDVISHPLVRHPVTAYRSFLAWATARKRGDEAAGRRWAAGIYKGVYGRWPPRSFDLLPHDPVFLTFEVQSFCRREMARYASRRTRDAA